MSHANIAKLIPFVHHGAKQLMIVKITSNVSSVIYAVRKRHVAKGVERKMTATSTAIVVGVTFA